MGRRCTRFASRMMICEFKVDLTGIHPEVVEQAAAYRAWRRIILPNADCAM